VCSSDLALTEAFGGAGSADAAAKRKRLAQMEQATFSGSSGTGKSSFAQQNTGQI
jgi:putative ribosome biogenesis GTPase RsgA